MRAPRISSRRSLRGLALTLGLGSLTLSCGDDAGGTQPGGPQSGDAGLDGGRGSFYPVAEASDPCGTAGYFFDGESDCDVVRCPELSCECESAEPPAAGESPPPPQVVTLSACVSGVGCLSLVDCNRVCDPSLALTRNACDARIESAGALSCRGDDDCVVGQCREESVGSICVDVPQCAADGHCGAGAACLFDPDSLDPETSRPTSLGSCADGSPGSRCYDDDACVFGRCEGEQCNSGLEGSQCAFNGHCASGFCRITNPMDQTGSCVSGMLGGACTDDGDCGDGLHCASGLCFTGAVGQPCMSDEQCESRVCFAGRCRGGELGSLCEVDADCKDAFCVGSYCVSGALYSRCYEANDCKSGLSCARQLCSDGSKDAPCSVDADCKVLGCVNGVCSDGANGAECEQDDDCTSQRCANPAGVESGQCTTGAPGSFCVSDGHCLSASCNLGGVCD